MKSIISRLFLLATMIVVFAGCEKEYSVEGVFTGLGTQGGTAIFTLDGAPGACMGAQVQGAYAKDVPTTSNNLVSLTVNVTQLGTYTISTGTINGISFSGSGTFTVLGIQFIQLNATGTPTSSGTSTFLPGTSPCAFTVTIGGGTGGGSTGTAAYTFNGAPNACVAPIVGGTYTVGTALNAADTVILLANVTTAGTYVITTTGNGMTFTAIGTFTTTGANQKVKFVGSGTPIAAGNINFAPGNATSKCTFTVAVTAAGTTPSTFIFTGAPGACTTPVINGTYTQGSALTAANTVVLQINVTVPGTYTISATGGGMTFSKTGSFTTTGGQTVSLNGNGTPTAAGVVSLTPTGASSAGCTFQINVLPTGSPASGFTFAGAPGACTAPVISGIYTKGTALTSSNTVSLQVNVTSIGTYSITAAAGGITFSKTNTFTSTGTQTVVLTGSGTPTNSGAVSFTPTGASAAGCTFTINVAASGPTVFLKATINGVAYEFNGNLQTQKDLSGTPSFVSMLGVQSSPSSSTANLEIDFVNEVAAIATGNFANFATGTNTTRYIDAYYTNNASVDFTTDDAAAGSFTGVLSTLTANSATGTFQGTLKSAGGTSVTITNGSFNITY